MRKAFLGFVIVNANEKPGMIFRPCTQLVIALSKFLTDHGDTGDVLCTDLLENPVPVCRTNGHIVVSVFGFDKSVGVEKIFQSFTFSA